MTKSQALQDLANELHISYSQIFTYLACSLKYKLQYVENRRYERIGSSLFLGSAIHTSIERYYKSLKNKGVIEPLNILTELLEDCIALEIDNTDVPIIYKKEAPDREGLVQMGKALLKTFYENVDLNGFEIVDVEAPLSARLYTDEGDPTDFQLIGIVDLILMDENNDLVVVDNKTAAKPKSQSAVDDDLQFSAYSYLVASNKLTFPTAPIKCRMDVLRKLKTPKMEYYHSVRTGADRKRFAKIASTVLAGIDSRIFIPQRSWLCTDCAYPKACSKW